MSTTYEAREAAADSALDVLTPDELDAIEAEACAAWDAECDALAHLAAAHRVERHGLDVYDLATSAFEPF
ncbi:MAG TPA: hypothetical protein VFL91_24325 [Thermomicrobiales bacterium]|nr:hypothetical protein [Thermomicrobiales bacterium]